MEQEKTLIVFVIHAHQPYFQFPEVRNAIYYQSYLPLLRILEKYPHARMVLSITKSAGEWLPWEFFEILRSFILCGQVEFLATSAYHYILPLAPPDIISEQIRLHTEFFNQKLEINPTPGVYLPEYAFSPETARAIYNSGYLWTIADDKFFAHIREKDNFPPELRVPNNWIATSENCAVFLTAHDRSHDISRGIYQNGYLFLKDLLDGQRRWRDRLEIKNKSYIVLGVDWETFGHHWPHDSLERFFIPFLEGISSFRDECELTFFSSLIRQFPMRPAEIPHGSWATSIQDFAHGSHFPLWNHPDNPFHRAWNEFMQITFSLARNDHSEELSRFVNRIFASDIPWMHSHGKREIARIPLEREYQEILKLFPESTEKNKLQRLLDNMMTLLI